MKMKPHSITTILAGILFLASGATARAVDLIVTNGTSIAAPTLVSGSNTFTTDAGMTGTITGAFSASGPADAILVKLGGGVLSLTTAYNRPGPTAVLEGTLRLATGAATLNSLNNIIAGPGSTLWLGNSLSIGSSGAGSLYMSNGGLLDITQGTNTLTVGTGAGADGALVATGAGTQISVSGAMYIANNAATGRVDILDGATLTVGGLMDVARQAGGQGSLFVDGTGSRVSVTGAFSISPNGTGTLSITNGGTMSTGNFNPVGTLVTSTASIIVDGPTSRLTAAAIGAGNGFATFMVSNGGQINGTSFANISNVVVMLGNGGLFSVNNSIAMLGKLTGSGTFMSVTGTITTAATTVLAPGVFGSEGIGELHIGSTLTLTGATLLIDTAAGGQSDKITVGGDLLLTGARSTIDIGSFNTGTFTILTTTGTIGNTAGRLDVDSVKVSGSAPSARNGVGVSIINNNALQLALFTNNLAMAWTNNAGDAAWSSAASSANWSTPLDATVANFMDGDFVTFDAVHSGSVAIDGAVTVSGMNVDGDYRFTGDSITGDTTERAGVVATGRLTKTGAGTLSFENGANDFAGGIDIAGGVVAFTNGNQLGTSGTTLSFSDSGTLRAGADALSLGNNMEIAAGKSASIDTNSYNLAYTGTLTSASTGTLAKAGAGTLTLTGDSSANGGSNRVTAGTLALAAGAKLKGDTAIAGGQLFIDAGATLLGNATADGASASIAGVGTISGNVSLTNGALLRIGADGLAAPGLFDITGSLLVADSMLSFDFVGGTNCVLNAGAGVTATGSNTINIGAASLATGTYTLGNIGDIMNSGTLVVLVDNNAQSSASRTKATVFRDTVTPANLLLSYGMDVSRFMTWNLPGGGTWNAALQNWTGDGQTLFQNGDTVTFATGAADAIITIANSTPRVSDITVDTTGAGTLTFAGLGIYASATTAIGNVLTAPTGKLVKIGTGALVFNNDANYFEGGIDIGGGLVVFTNGNQLATGEAAPMSFSDSGTLRAGADALTLGNNMEIAAGKSALIDTNSYNLAFTGTLTSASTGTLAKAGAGTLTLTGDSSANGGSNRITAGTLALAPNAKLKGDTAITSGLLLVNAGATLLGNATADGASSSIAGVGTISGNVSLTNGALLRIGADGLAAPNLFNITGSLLVADSILSFDFVGGTNCVLNAGASVTATGSNTINIGAASLTTGTYTLGNIGNLMNSGTVVVLIDNTAQSSTSRTKATVFRDTATPANLLLSYGMDMSRLMTWNLPGSGTWNAALQNWTGDGLTLFQNGDTVKFATGAADAVITVANSVPRVSDMTVDTTGAGTLTFAGLGIYASATTALGNVLVAPSGKLFKIGTGALVFNNDANYFEDGIDIGGGVVVFNNGNQLATGGAAALSFSDSGTLRPGADALSFGNTLAIAAGKSALIDTGSYNLAYTGTFSSASTGTFTKAGAGTLTLTGNSSTNGGSTRVTAGTLALAPGAKLKGDTAIASGQLFIDTGATLLGNATATGASASIAGVGTISGNVSLTNGALLRIGADGLAAPATLDITGTLLVANSTLSFDFVGGTSCMLNADAGVAATGLNTINIATASLVSGAYALGNIGGILDSGTVVVLIDNNTQSTATRTHASVLKDSAAPSGLLLYYGMDVSRFMTWNLPASGGGSGTWNASLENWSGDGQTVFQNGDTVNFATGAANTVITIANSAPRVSDMQVDNTGAGTLTFDGLGIYASATTATGNVLTAPSGKLVKIGTGALVFNNDANYFEGGIDIGDGAAGATGGLLVFNHANQLGVSDGAAITFKNSGTLEPGSALDAADILSTNINIDSGVAATIDTVGCGLAYSGTLKATGAGAMLHKAGAGALTLLGDSGNYTGAIDIDQGALMLAGGVIGGTINVRSGAAFGGWGFATGTNSVHLWSGGSVLLTDTTNALDIANLVFEQNSNLTGQGVLTGAATIADGVATTATVAAGNTITLAGAFSGTGGALTKTGDGELRVGAASSVYVGNVNINQGALTLSASSQIRTRSSLNINEGGILRADGNSTVNLDATSVLVNNGMIEVGRAAGANHPYSTLTIDGGRYVGGYGASPTGGKISVFISDTLTTSGTTYTVQADKIVFGPNTMVSGTTWIEIRRSATPALFSMSEMPALVEVSGTSMPGAFFKSDAIGQAGSAYDMWFEWTQAGGSQWKQDIAAEIPPVTGLDTSAILIGRASFDSLGQRLRSTHRDNSPRKFTLWANGLYRADKLKPGRFSDIKANTWGVQAGAEWDQVSDTQNRTTLLGIYYDYATTDMKQPGGASSTDTNAHGFGAYGSIKVNSWYTDIMMRYSWEDYTVSIPRRNDIGTKGNSGVIAVQTGMVLDNFLGYKMEPNIRITRQTHGINNTTDEFGRVYEISGVDSFETRAGISLWDEFVRKNGLRTWPRIGLNAVYEFRGRSDVTVEGQRFDNSIKGFGTLVDIGLATQLSRRTTLDIGASWQFSESLESLYFNVGLGCKW